MGDAWLDGFKRVPNAKSEGGSYVDGVPWRFAGHMTEVVPTSVAGAEALAGRHEYPPHIWAWPEEGWRCQTVRLDRSAFALKHPAGTPETNKMRAIQAEVIGFSRDSPGKPDSFWEWIGREVVRPVVDAGYAIDLSLVAPTTGADGAGTGGKVRMSRAAWRAFGGVCVHANVPDNDHWDMGAANLALVASAARGDDMAFTPAQEKLIVDAATIIANGVPAFGVDSFATVAVNVREVMKQQDVDVKAVLAAIAGVPAKVAAAIPPGGGATPAQIEAACRTAVVAELGFLKPGV